MESKRRKGPAISLPLFLVLERVFLFIQGKSWNGSIGRVFLLHHCLQRCCSVMSIRCDPRCPSSMAEWLGTALGPVLGHSPALPLFPAQELNTPASWAGYLEGPPALLQFHGNGTLQVTGTGCADKSGCACGNTLVSLPFPILGAPVPVAGRGTDAALLSFRMAPASVQPCSGHQGGSAQSQRARTLCSPLATAVGSVVSGGHGPIPPPCHASCPTLLPLAPWGKVGCRGCLLLVVS